MLRFLQLPICLPLGLIKLLCLSCVDIRQKHIDIDIIVGGSTPLKVGTAPCQRRGELTTTISGGGASRPARGAPRDLGLSGSLQTWWCVLLFDRRAQLFCGCSIEGSLRARPARDHGEERTGSGGVQDAAWELSRQTSSVLDGLEEVVVWEKQRERVRASERASESEKANYSLWKWGEREVQLEKKIFGGRLA
jgi:hypothetical protein